MQSSIPADSENLTPSRFNSTVNNKTVNKSPNPSTFRGMPKAAISAAISVIQPQQSGSKEEVTVNDCQEFQSSTPAKGQRNNPHTDNRFDATSPTSTRALKKHKPEMELSYPNDVKLPTKSLIRALYESVVSQEGSHQSQLDHAGSGLLSLEEVLFPAVAREETNALKIIQAKAQRDASDEVVETLKLCRRAIYEGVESGIVAARAARLTREAEENQRQERLKQERAEAKMQRRLQRQAEKQRDQLQRAQARRESKERKRSEMKKQLPKNMEMWKEVAFLMTEQANIKKEQRLWKEAEKNLTVKAEELAALKTEQENRGDDETIIDSMHSNVDKEFKERVDSAVEDITLSSLRIQRAAELVSSSLGNANTTRTQLFKKYTTDHQFHGYAGVKDPKSLIRILSQEP